MKRIVTATTAASRSAPRRRTRHQRSAESTARRNANILEPTDEDLEISGRELQDLLDPIPPTTFLRDYWGKRPLHIPGNPEKLGKLLRGAFDRATFDHLLRRAAERKLKGFSVYAGRREGRLLRVGQPALPFPAIQPDQFEAALARGETVAIQNPGLPRLALLITALKAQLGSPGSVEIYTTLSPEGAGYTAHFDRASTFMLQCEGTKRWTLSALPILKWPRASAMITEAGTAQYTCLGTEEWEQVAGADRAEFIEVIMAPGDVLHIPPGVIHGTEAVGGHSLAVNLHFDHSNFLAILTNALERRLLANPEWRHVPVMGDAPDSVPAEMEQFFAARLAEVRTVLEGMAPGGIELQASWRQLIADPGSATLASLPTINNSGAGRPIRKTDTLRLSRRAPLSHARGAGQEGEPVMSLYYGNREVTVSGEWVPFLEGVLRQELFVAEAATAWAKGKEPYPWELVQEYLEALRDQGVVQHDVEDATSTARS